MDTLSLRWRDSQEWWRWIQFCSFIKKQMESLIFVCISHHKHCCRLILYMWFFPGEHWCCLLHIPPLGSLINKWQRAFIGTLVEFLKQMRSITEPTLESHNCWPHEWVHVVGSISFIDTMKSCYAAIHKSHLETLENNFSVYSWLIQSSLDIENLEFCNTWMPLQVTLDLHECYVLEEVM